MNRHDKFWTAPIDVLFAQVQSRGQGLTSAEAAERLQRFGANLVIQSKPKRLLGRIAKRFADPLVAILLVAAAISGVTGDVASFAIILMVVSLSISLDIVQEQRADTAVEALKRSVAVHADVLRDGQLASMPIDQIVPGDVVELRAGDLVPADGVVLRSRDAHVNEALMTGEPFPVEKRAGSCDAPDQVDAFNVLFAGTSVVSGEAKMLVVLTGDETRFGQIAETLNAGAPPSALERGVIRLGGLILRLTSFLVLFVLLVQVALGRPVLETFLFAVALAVGLTPELLPMIVTVTLSHGAIRMARKQVIVKRLAAIHDLGAMDVLCTDKTGTLTQAQITLVGHPNANGGDSDRVLALACVNSSFSSGIRSPLDQAIVSSCPASLVDGWSKVDEIPFDFERRSVAISATNGEHQCLILKGAPEQVLDACASLESDDGTVVPIDITARQKLVCTQEELATQGQRLLAVAWKSLPPDRREIAVEDETDLVFCGFCTFVDPPKPTAAAAIERLLSFGIRVKVISGDHDQVVRHVAKALKIPSDELLTGAEIAGLTDSALVARVQSVDLFARVTPDQKSRIIRALQVRGYTVGFLGDGVNDAPAIRAAEIGLSAEGATDVARNAADMILLQPDLGVLADGVEEGRRTLANIIKYVRMGTSSNFGNMLSMAMASLVLPFLPLLPVQILLNNLLYDLSEIGIPFDYVDRQQTERPSTWDMRDIMRFTLIMGTLSSLFDFTTFAILICVFHVNPTDFRSAWFLESMLTQILVIFIIRTHAWPWASRAHPFLVATSSGGIIAALVCVFTPVATLFGFSVLPLPVLSAIIGVVAVYLVSAEFAAGWARFK